MMHGVRFSTMCQARLIGEPSPADPESVGECPRNKSRVPSGVGVLSVSIYYTHAAVAVIAGCHGGEPLAVRADDRCQAHADL